jgi:hypothetical protein
LRNGSRNSSGRSGRRLRRLLLTVVFELVVMRFLRAAAQKDQQDSNSDRENHDYASTDE